MVAIKALLWPAIALVGVFLFLVVFVAPARKYADLEAKYLNVENEKVKLEKEKLTLAGAESLLQQKTNEVLNKNEQIRDLRAQLGEKEAILFQLQDRIVEKEGEIGNLKGKYETARLETARLKEEQQRKMERRIASEVLPLPQGDEPPYEKRIIFTANHDITPVQMLVTCDVDIIQADLSIVGSSISFGAVGRKGPNSYYLEINSPVWTQLTPLMLTIKSNKPSPNCKIG